MSFRDQLETTGVVDFYGLFGGFFREIRDLSLKVKWILLEMNLICNNIREFA